MFRDLNKEELKRWFGANSLYFPAHHDVGHLNAVRLQRIVDSSNRKEGAVIVSAKVPPATNSSIMPAVVSTVCSSAVASSILTTMPYSDTNTISVPVQTSMPVLTTVSSTMSVAVSPAIVEPTNVRMQQTPSTVMSTIAEMRETKNNAAVCTLGDDAFVRTVNSIDVPTNTIPALNRNENNFVNRPAVPSNISPPYTPVGVPYSPIFLPSPMPTPIPFFSSPPCCIPSIVPVQSSFGNSSFVNSEADDYSESMDEIDDEIAYVQKKLELLKLKRQLATMERQHELNAAGRLSPISDPVPSTPPQASISNDVCAPLTAVSSESSLTPTDIASPSPITVAVQSIEPSSSTIDIVQPVPVSTPTDIASLSSTIGTIQSVPVSIPTDIAPSSSAVEFSPSNVDPNLRCYNCRQRGYHLSRDCPMPRRPEGGCFRCFGVGHTYRQCPSPRSITEQYRTGNLGYN